jgi:hypothetical protein
MSEVHNAEQQRQKLAPFVNTSEPTHHSVNVLSKMMRVSRHGWLALPKVAANPPANLLVGEL